MIPKQLFFIWLGNKPAYVDYAIKTYKEVNPDYTIDLFEENDINNPQNDLFKELIYYYNCNINNKDIDHISNKELFDIYDYETKQSVTKHFMYNIYYIISNTLRVYLVYKYGGIYIDCDTFPVKPFEDWLLEKPFQSYNDNFMIGGSIGTKIFNTCSLNTDFMKYIRTVYGFQYKDIHYDCEKLHQNAKLFAECKLKYGTKVLDDYDGKDYFLDHYNHYVLGNFL